MSKKFTSKKICMAALFLLVTTNTGVGLCYQQSKATAAHVKTRVNQIMKKQEISKTQVASQVRHEIKMLSNKELAKLARKLSVGSAIIGKTRGQERVGSNNASNGPSSIMNATIQRDQKILKTSMQDPQTRNKIEAMVTNRLLNNQ